MLLAININEKYTGPGKYVTEYLQDEIAYGSHIYASSREEAEKIARERGIGERIEGFTRNKTQLKPLSMTDFLHETVFLTYIRLTMGNISPIEALGDHSLIHEIVHWLSGVEDTQKKYKEIQKRIKELRASVPGYLPIKKQ